MSTTRPLIDEAVRDRVVEALDVSHAVAAGAGAGKTTLLVERIVRMLLDGRVAPERLAAITFTEKAAGQLTERVRDRLEDPSRAHPRRAAVLARFNELTLSTIHGFCRQLLLWEALDADWAPDTEVVAGVFQSPAVERAYRGWRRDFEARRPDASFALRNEGAEKHVRAVAMCLLANRDLSPRIGPPEVDWARLHADLRALAAKIRGLIEGAGSPSGCTLLRNNATALAALAEAAVLDDPRAAIEALGWPKTSGRGGKKSDWGEAVQDFKAALGEIKAFPERVEAARRGALHAVVVDDLRRRFLPQVGDARRATGHAAFDDLLFEAAKLLRERAEVRGRLADRFDAIFIDEVQDTDPIQAEVAALLTRHPDRDGAWTAHPPRPGRLFAVGDPKQSIYRFRRADVETWNDLRALIERRGEAHTLKQNFRSVPGIVDWVNHAFADLPDHPPQTAWRTAEASALDPVVSIPLPDEEIEPEEALLRHLVDLNARRGVRWRDMMVLIPSWTHANALQSAFDVAGVPAVVEGGRTFFGRDEVKLSLMALRALDEPADGEAVVATLRGLFGIPLETLVRHRLNEESPGSWRYTAPAGPEVDADIAAAFDALRALHLQRARASWVTLLDALLDLTRASAVWWLTPRGEGALANLDKLRAMIRAAEATAHDPGEVVALLLAQKADDADADLSLADADADAVRITSLFKAKGLEARVVAIVRAKRNLLPPAAFSLRQTREVVVGPGKQLRPADWDALYEEEKRALLAERRRWMYVAATRAMDQLVVVHGDGDKLLEPDIRRGLAGLADAEHDEARAVDEAGRAVVRVRRPERLPPTTATREAFPGHDERLEVLLNAEADVEDAEEVRWARARVEHVKRAEKASQRWRSATFDADEKRGRQPDSAPGVGAAGGRTVHEVMEHLFALQAPLATMRARAAALVEHFARRHHLSAEKTAACVDIVHELLDHPAVRRALAAPERFIELPFAHTDRGAIVAGAIDLCFPVDAERTRWVVIDWKSTLPRRGPDREVYERQLRRYARALLKTVAPCAEVETALVGPYEGLPDEAAPDLFEDLFEGLVAPLSDHLDGGGRRPVAGLELGEEGAEPEALFELAWPRVKLGLLVDRPASEARAARVAGWTAVEADSSEDGWAAAAMNALQAELRRRAS